MKIAGGEFAGRPLAAPKGPRIRPTRDQVRQALFNVLGGRVQGARVLDLFAGTGALGIEALSRGAAHAHFVDRSGFCLQAIRANLEGLGVSPARFTLVRGDAPSAVAKLAARAGRRFGLVFLDPPYDGDLATKTLNALCRCAIVSETGWVIAEHNKRDPLPPALEGPGGRLKSQRVEIYGDTALAFYSS